MLFTCVISDYDSFSLHRLRLRRMYELAAVVINIIRSSRSHYSSQTSSNFFCSLLDGCVNKNRLSILSYAISSSFFSSYVDSERNHHHFHLLAVEHERWIYYHISISQGYLSNLLFLFARRRSESQFSMILSTTRYSM